MSLFTSFDLLFILLYFVNFYLNGLEPRGSIT